jgi:hypothetical protein
MHIPSSIIGHVSAPRTQAEPPYAIRLSDSTQVSKVKVTCHKRNAGEIPYYFTGSDQQN